MEDQVTAISEWIDDHEHEMVEFLSEYIRYESTPWNEDGVQREHIEPFFSDAMDWDDVSLVEVTDADDPDRPNVNARLRGNGQGRNLLFNGHSDVVEASPEEWSNDPWDPIIENGRLYGRGACDMKGPNTAMIWAAKAIMDLGIELDGDLLMSVVVGEERGMAEYGSIPATKSFLDDGIDLPFCINTEATNNEIHTKSSGTFDFRIRIPGKEIHTSQRNLTRYPQRYGLPAGEQVGVDAVPMMISALERLQELEHDMNMRYRDRVYGSGGYPIPRDMQGVGAVGINCTLIEAGNYIASVPGFAEIRGHVYYPPYFEADDVWDEMRQVIDDLSTTNSWLRDHPPQMECKENYDWPPFETALEHPGNDTLGGAVEAVTDESPVFSGYKAVNDNGYLQDLYGLDAVSLGPGNLLMGAHGQDEYIDLDQLTTAAKIYATMIAKWCGVVGNSG